MIVPTGIGASIGGYAGDALPAARLLSCVVDRLITHPNVLNGKDVVMLMFIKTYSNVLLLTTSLPTDVLFRCNDVLAHVQCLVRGRICS